MLIKNILYFLVGVLALPFVALYQLAIALGDLFQVEEAFTSCRDLGRRIVSRK